MAFKVFLSYRNAPDEQLAVWRLQTLAAAYGIHVFVPPRNGLQHNLAGRGRPLSAQVQRMIDESDCVLAIMTGPPGPAVTSELNYAVAKKKTVVPVLQTGIQQSPILDRMPQVFRFSPGNPGKVEAEVVQFLKSQEFDKQNRQAIGALVMVGLGLLVMSALSDK